MGLLARANELLEKEKQKDELELQQLAVAQKELLNNLGERRGKKFTKVLLGALLGLSLTAAAPTTLNRTFSPEDFKFDIQPKVTKTAELPAQDLEASLQQFQKGLISRVSDAERDMIAQMVYGEAGRGADPFEVIHTVLNRMSSPLFSGTAADVVTQKNQYVGYNAKHPVTKDYRRMVDMAVDEWEAHGCKIDGCHHYYFVTGIPGVCNKFEISHDHKGGWVKGSEKDYAPMQHYCDVATDQAARFFAERDHNL